MPLHIHLFGHLHLADGGEAIRLLTRSLRLLVYLLLHRGAPAAREAAAFALWPDTLESEALANLRRALSDLRSSLPARPPAEWIVASAGNLRWNPDAPYWLDTEEFERCVRQGGPAALHRAVELHARELLPQLSDEWVVTERERLGQMQAEALAQLTAHHRALGEYEAALRFAQRLATTAPLDESAHRELMALHYLSGDRPAALAQFENLRTLLSRELSVEPMSESLALREAIAEGRPIPAAAAPPRRTAGAIPAIKPLPHPIGRQPEMAELAQLWENAAAGRGRMVIVSGEAGVGKSHLVHALAQYASKRGGLALVGQCYEFEQALPYHALIMMLRSAAGLLAHVDLAPAHRAALARLAPDVLGAAGTPAGDVAPAGESRAQFLEAMLQAFLALSRLQPVLLVFEDAQWASESTLDWLAYITPRLAGAGLLVVITFRSDEVGAGHALARMQRRFGRDGAVSTLLLAPLKREAFREWVRQLSGLEAEAALPVADRLFAETVGNPFFLREVLRGLIESGDLVDSRGGWSGRLVEGTPPVRVPLPDSLRETINARVKRLSDTSEVFIRVAAAAGQLFEYDVVRQAGGWNEEQALEALEDLLARDFVRREPEAGAFSFAHHLVREAIYAEMTRPRRRYWHQRLGEALERLYADGSHLGDCAHQFALAEVWDKASDYAERAGRRSEANYADAEASQWYAQALQAERRTPTPNLVRQFDLLAHRLRVEERQGNYDAMVATLADMEAVARQSSDEVLLAGALLSRGHFLSMVGPIREAVGGLDECVRLCERLGREDLLAQALVDRSRAFHSQLRDGDALADMQRALALYHAGAGFPSEADRIIHHAAALRQLGYMYVRLGRFQDALDVLDESLARLESLPVGRLDEVALTKLELGWSLQVIGATARAMLTLDEAQELLRRIELRGVLVEAHLLELILQMGAGSHGLQETRQAVYRPEQASHWQARPDVRVNHLGLLAWFELAAGRPELALADVQAALPQVREIGELSYALLLAPTHILCHVALGQVEAALEVSAQALETLGTHESYAGPHIRFGRYMALNAAGRSQEALPLLRQAHESLAVRLADLRDPNLRREASQALFHSQVLEAWEKLTPDRKRASGPTRRTGRHKQ